MVAVNPRAVDRGPKAVHFWTMKVMNISTAKSKLGQVIDQVVKTRDPVVILRGVNHVIIRACPKSGVFSNVISRTIM